MILFVVSQVEGVGLGWSNSPGEVVLHTSVIVQVLLGWGLKPKPLHFKVTCRGSGINLLIHSLTAASESPASIS